MTRLTTTALRLAALSPLVALSSCSDHGRDITEPDALAASLAAILSDPVERSSIVSARALGAAQASSARSGGDVVYVSLPPGTMPEGLAITVRNLETEFMRTEPLIDGGLDPLPVPAVAGGQLKLIATLTGGSTLSSVVTVPARRAPRVVRTVPPRGKTDVPLNARILVVFSEPMDPRTLNTTSIRLLRGTEPVAGQLELLDPRHLTAAFIPSALLAAGANYELVVDQGVRDLDGEPLEATVTVAFATGSAPAPVDRVTLEPGALTLAPGETFQARATAHDLVGDDLTGRAVTWSSADPTVATVSAAGVVTAARLGTTTVTATAEGKSATATINVVELIFASVSAGIDYSCGLTTSGAAYCWGANDLGQLGTGTSGHSPTPAAVTGGLTFVQLSTGGTHACGLTAAGEAYCWGYDQPDLHQGPGGLLGAVTGETCGYYNPCSTRPLAVTGGLKFTSINAGGTHTCGVTSEGVGYCWGENTHGQLGNGTTVSSAMPVAVAGGLKFASIAASRGGFLTCGLTRQGRTYCWGRGGPTLGTGLSAGPQMCPYPPSYPRDCSTVPVAVAGADLAFTTVRVGGHHACGLTASGTVHCWGYVHHWGTQAVPFALPTEHTYEAIEVYSNSPFWSTCLIASGGSLYCLVGSGFRALPVPGDIAFASVSPGDSHACGVTRERRAYCWGYNGYGQVGHSTGVRPDGSFGDSYVPVKVMGQR